MSRHTSVAVAVALTGASAVHAASVVQTRFYEFGLEEQPIASLALVYGNDAYFSGGTQVSFNQFDAGLGTLTQVKLHVQMTIAGEMEIGSQPPPDVFLAAITQAYPLTLTFDGAAQAGPLFAEIDFGDYEVGVDGAVQNDVLVISETGEGEDATTAPGDLAFFIGNGSFNAPVWASVFVEYLEQQVGSSDNLTAFGEVRLTYDYRGEHPIIPTPAALPLGAALFTGLLLRRGRDA